MDEAHFRPPRPARTARILTAVAGAALVGAVIGWFAVGLLATIAAAVAVVVLLVVATLLRRVELIVSRSGIEVVDIGGRRRQAWVGTDRLLIDFARARPLLEIDAPGPGAAYRSTLVLAGLESDEYREARQQLAELVHAWAGPHVRVEVIEPGGGPILRGDVSG